jgi:potassium efflux system protein
MLRRITVIIFLVFSWSLVASMPGQAQEITSSSGKVAGTFADEDPRLWLDRLDVIELEIGQVDRVEPKQIRAIAFELGELHRNARALANQMAKQIAQLQREIDSLGLAPAEGKPSESPEDALLRLKLQERLSALESRRRLSRLVITRVENLQGRLAQVEASWLNEQLFVRTPSLFLKETWVMGGASAQQLVVSLVRSPSQWWRQIQREDVAKLTSVVAVVLLFAVLAYLLRRRLIAWIDRRKQAVEPTYAARVVMAFSTATAEIALPVLSLGAAAFSIRVFSAMESWFNIAN